MNMEQKVDAWWAQQGRADFVARASLAANDSKIKAILADQSLKPAEKLAKIEPRVDKDLVPFLMA